MERSDILKQLWNAQNKAYDLMVEYDALPHHYGEDILFQAEGHIIDLIAVYPGISITDLSNIQKKTVSACSQIVSKLKEKGFVEQKRDRTNKRQYNLTLTKSGMKLYQAHREFTEDCRQKTYELLKEFSNEELYIHYQVQMKLNEAYEDDIDRSRDLFYS